MARDTIAPAKRNHEVVHHSVILALLRSCHVTIMSARRCDKNGSGKVPGKFREKGGPWDTI